ncbi:MAG TPA: hypothetical protein VHV28_05220 [Solirubrobacteraceae bacterium]|jgi:cytoskeletal protein RodZ|nr:hypothetical protein [Solirubrobacteraceae bacterium]
MPTLNSLPGDQHAVLEMVLKRGRSYDEIARLLSLDRAAVRERAQIALDTIGPHTEVAPAHQHLIADYLLGQLSDAEAAEVRNLLADSPTDRAWARVVASELAPLTGDNPLPEIPVERSAPREPDTPESAPPAPAEPLSAPTSSGLGPAQPDAEPKRRRRLRRKRDAAAPAVAAGDAPRSSRLGGALVLLVGVVAVAAVLFFVLRGGHAKHKASTVSTTSVPAASAPTTTPASSTPTTSTSGTSASVVAQINLSPPSADKTSKAAGIAEVLNEGSIDGIAVVAQNVPANATKPPNAYAVWLYNSQKDAQILGFVNPAVGKTGRLSTAGRLPANASHYKELVVTVETTASPKQPGTIILQGALTSL